ncbi:TrmB family transcriptional regulator [Nakamurella lactea]|uniref:TrmB family transcriptional regulator n=1 Tax=Nakamurella lactea TaxID=459515 RepID=UPI0004132858|nr:helix-turn-helix domain-containing protein [Nakamurella lactea]
MLHDVLGLTSDQAAAYRELVAVPSASAEELAARLQRTAVETAGVLTVLEKAGLAARSSGDRGRFVAAPPAIAMGALLVKRQNEMRLAELELGALEDTYRMSAAGRGAADVVDVVYGAEAVGRRFEMLQLGARREVMAFVKPPTIAVPADENTAEDQAVARGVAYRVVTERRTLDDPAYLAATERAIEDGEQVRITENLPQKLVIIDRAAAFLPMASAAGPTGIGALVVRESGLLDALLALFETIWDRSIPVTVKAGAVGESAGGTIDELDAKIVRLLLAGFTDVAVSKSVGTSLRSVQRRVHRLMEVAGVQTRMQLGWQAKAQGWA